MTIAERIITVCENNEKNMTDFAEKLNVTPAYISKMKKNPETIPSDRFILNVCSQYGVNYDWIKTGEGSMNKTRTDEEELEDWIGRIQFDKINGSKAAVFKSKLLVALSHIKNDSTWEDLYNVIDEVVNGKTDQ